MKNSLRRSALASMLVASLLLLSLFSLSFAVPRSSASVILQNPSVASTYSIRDSFFISTFETQSPFGIRSINYFVVRGEANSSSVSFSSSSGATLSIITNSDMYSITLSSGTISGKVNVTIQNREQISVTSPPQLMRVDLVQNGTVEGVWAGYLTSIGTVTGNVYYNPNIAASLELEYENGAATSTYSIALSSATSYSLPVGNLAKVSASISSSSTLATQASIQFPVRYQPMSLDLNSTFSAENNYSLVAIQNSLSYSSSYEPNLANFQGAMVPALDWQLMGSATVSSSLVSINESVTGMYGVNGNSLGFTNFLYGAGYAPVVSGYDELSMSSSIIALSNSPDFLQSGPFTSSQFRAGNSTAIVLVGGSGEVESTASIETSHSIFTNMSGTLTDLRVNSTQQFVVIFQNNSTSYVNLVLPQSETNSTFSVSGKNYTADKVIVSGAGYIVFYAQLTASGSYQIYKATSSGSVELNSQNYYTVNGSALIFDDPLTTYYVVYGVPPPFPLTIIEIGIVVAIIVALVGIFFIRRGMRTTSLFPS